LNSSTLNAAEPVRRWKNAREKLQAAQLCFDQQLYGESATRSYYACYQAIMNSVVADGLLRSYCPLLIGLRKKLETLYRLRIAVDYAADSILRIEAESGLDTGGELLRLIAHHTQWTL
jgi:hypothetical protein